LNLAELRGARAKALHHIGVPRITPKSLHAFRHHFQFRGKRSLLASLNLQLRQLHRFEVFGLLLSCQAPKFDPIL